MFVIIKIYKLIEAITVAALGLWLYHQHLKEPESDSE
jgi:hypothetical protein